MRRMIFALVAFFSIGTTVVLAGANDAYLSYTREQSQIEALIDRNPQKLKKGQAESLKSTMTAMRRELYNAMATTERSAYYAKVDQAKAELRKIRAQVE
jgi:hypothetical protein